MALLDMTVFNRTMYTTATETIRQNIELFNAASGNTLTLRQFGNQGDFAMEASYADIPSLMRRRDAYGSGTITATTLSQLNHVAVKIAGGTSPVLFEPQQFEWIQRSPEEAGLAIGEQIAKGVVADEVNTAIMALRAALSGNSDVVYDGTASNLSLSSMNKGAALFGDRAGSLGAWITHSKSMHDLYDSNLTNGQDLFEFGTVKIMQDGFGRRLIMTDSPALYEADVGGEGVDNYYTLGLAGGAAVVEDNNDYYATMQEIAGSENIQRIFQAEYSYNLGLKGYTWDTSIKSPTDAALATAGNWTKLATDNKSTAGVLITSL